MLIPMDYREVTKTDRQTSTNPTLSCAKERQLIFIRTKRWRVGNLFARYFTRKKSKTKDIKKNLHTCIIHGSRFILSLGLISTSCIFVSKLKKRKKGEWLIQYRKITHVRLPLRPTHAHIWCSRSTPWCAGSLVFTCFSVTASVVYPPADLLRVHKYKLLGFLVPLVFQFLLADWTYGVSP